MTAGGMNEASAHAASSTSKNGRVDLSHGAGGRAMADADRADLSRRVRQRVAGAGQRSGALSKSAAGRMVMTTDAYVVSPLFFPGGDIGSLAVHGTINDVAMAGARPLYLSAASSSRRAFRSRDLQRIADSMGEAARAAGVPIVTGDTKVVERGKGDGVFITTTGVGVGAGRRAAVRRPGASRRRRAAVGHDRRPRRGRHVEAREPGVRNRRSCPTAPRCMGWSRIWSLPPVAHLRVMRDPTRGGLAATLNELAQPSGVGFRIEEAAIPVKRGSRGGVRISRPRSAHTSPTRASSSRSCAPEAARALLAVMRAHPLGRERGDHRPVVEDDEPLRRRCAPRFGGGRIVDWLAGEQLAADLLRRSWHAWVRACRGSFALN